MTNSILKHFVAFAILFVAFLATTFADSAESEAILFLKKVYATYPSLSSYSDEGVVTVTSYSGDKKPLKYKKEFVTRYVAPDSLLFAWKEEKPFIGVKEYAVWGGNPRKYLL
jgi:hypothetical protein